MEINRVRQILSSSADIDVEYQGAAVWIDDISEDGLTATVHLRGPLEQRTIVPVRDLHEIS
ncbi:H-type small acid-soluble spore protein [Bacillus carboniphilus]|uniref:H-type small acid-soluble spore protein n=1 Tax=Bacillus carboniphilus TaxID=86663 RepID=A0ABY9JU59_9BACI|nr:H-type small acid-soluble spore protein [Bacillus carboniphilus]WLR42952.1 H-type small acid-soluble spore protein [Bacillus carboniphilus]